MKTELDEIITNQKEQQVIEYVKKLKNRQQYQYKDWDKKIEYCKTERYLKEEAEMLNNVIKESSYYNKLGRKDLDGLRRKK